MAHVFPNLADQQFLSLTTYRKSGAAVATPVWFAEDNGRLVLTTQDNSGKIKRIKNNPQVQVAPCDRRGALLGPAASGRARQLSETEGKIADQILLKKYGLMKRLFQVMQLFSRSKITYFEIVPAA